MKWAFPACGAWVLLLPWAQSSAAAEWSADSVVSAVTVYPDRALVSRSVKVQVPAGAHTVVVSGLPVQIETDSLRVEGPGGTKISAVETKRIFAADLVRDDERRLAQELQLLRDDSQAAANRILALQDQLAFIRALGAKAAEGGAGRAAEGKADPSEWRRAWSMVGQGSADTLDAIQKETVAKRAIDEKVSQKERELNAIRSGARESLQARIALAVNAAGAQELTLRYQIANAGWQPAYEVRLDTEGSRGTLTQRARVRQNTGEDWPQASLTLSTSQPALGTQPPVLQPWFIDYPRFMPLQRKSAEAADAPAPEHADTTLAMAAHAEPEILSTEFATEYRIAGAVTVPSDGEPHLYTISEFPLAADLSVRAVPKLRPAAYLHAKAKYEGAAPLPAGTVQLYRDNALVGQDALGLLRPGDALALGFGIDERVSVRHELVSTERSRVGVLNKRQRVERRYRIHVQNFHRRPLEMSVYDQVPVPADESIEVERLPGTPPTQADVDGKQGVVAWTRTYAPGEQFTIEFNYAVNFPENREVPGF